MVAAQDPPPPDYAAEFRNIIANNEQDGVKSAAVYRYLGSENVKCVANIQKYFDDNKIATDESKDFIHKSKTDMHHTADDVRTTLGRDESHSETTTVEAAKKYSDTCQGLLAQAKEKFPPPK